MSTKTKIIIILLAFICFAGGVLYLVYSFFSAFGPDKITVTNTAISSSRGFINPVTIERLRVDSIGDDQRPVKYVIEYLTTCAIKQEEGRPPVALKKIKLNEPGRYRWSHESAKIPIDHTGLSRIRTDSAKGIIWSTGHGKFDICPIKFKSGTWYCITFLDPQIAGVYVYIGKEGELQQFNTYTGVSPI